MAAQRRRKSSAPRPLTRSSRPAPSRAPTSVVRRRRDLLADVARCLVGARSIGKTLAHVARACLPELAELCIVDVMQRNGNIQRLEAVHVDPSRLERMREVKRKYPPLASNPITDVFRTGRSVLTPVVNDDFLARMAADPVHLMMLRRHGPRSTMSVAVVVGGRTVAVLTFTITDSTRRYGRADLQLAEEIAGMCSAALAAAI